MYASSARENYEEEAHQCFKCKFGAAVGAAGAPRHAFHRRTAKTRPNTALRLCSAQLCFAFVSPFLKAVYDFPLFMFVYLLPFSTYFSQRETKKNVQYCLNAFAQRTIACLLSGARARESWIRLMNSEDRNTTVRRNSLQRASATVTARSVFIFCFPFVCSCRVVAASLLSASVSDPLRFAET